MTGKADFEELKVLVVDDDRFMLSLVRSILQTLGFKRILDVTDANKAFDALQDFPADLIITDWQMEPIDGLAFVQLVRHGEESHNHYVPIIMLSAHLDKDTVVKARDAGVNEVVAKPVSVKALESRIVAILENQRPFVRAESYFGPDRRRRDNGPPPGLAERRKARADKVDEGEIKEIRDLLGR